MKLSKEKLKEYQKLIIVSILIGFLCAILGDSLKKITEYYESNFSLAADKYWFLYFLFPIFGLAIIHLLRKYLFDNKDNKGIKEIYATLKTRHNELPIYKIPSHYFNGLLTVVFGGSTGIEVSTVVASATMGAVAQKKGNIHPAFRKELICAGVAAGIAAVFNSPIAGIIFAVEVISKRLTVTSIISILLAVLTVWSFNGLLHGESLFKLTLLKWHYHAIPYFLLLGIFAGVEAVYVTKTVLFFKNNFSILKKYSYKILISGIILGTAFLVLPQLYGEGYHAMKNVFTQSLQPIAFSYALLLVIGGLLILKPIVTSATLSAGGDGGVFAPSLFAGAYLGLLLALILNKYFNANVVPVNFMVVGMAAVLSGSLHAPFTAVFLACSLVDNYTLILPVFVVCFIAKLTAKMVYPYTVYTYVPVVREI